MHIDQNTALCLACSASLPPRTIPSFNTKCCSKPICESCLEQNPRLRRYNPCLACLGGVSAVSSSSTTVRNVDGGMKDADMFVLDDEDEEDAQTTEGGAAERVSEVGKNTHAAPSEVESGKYFISKRDTLQGLAFKLGVDARLLCRLNNLPTSTLTTTPHLLHTREYLLIPGNHIMHQARTKDDETRKAQRALEKAAKKLQLVTKETDWRVANAYAALASWAGEEEEEEYGRKMKESGGRVGGRNRLEEIATAMYLSDEEWESTHGPARNRRPL